MTVDKMMGMIKVFTKKQQDIQKRMSQGKISDVAGATKTFDELQTKINYCIDFMEGMGQ